MLVNSRELLIKASKDGYAIGAYNINNSSRSCKKL